MHRMLPVTGSFKTLFNKVNKSLDQKTNCLIRNNVTDRDDNYYDILQKSNRRNGIN